MAADVAVALRLGCSAVAVSGAQLKPEHDVQPSAAEAQQGAAAARPYATRSGAAPSGAARSVVAEGESAATEGGGWYGKVLVSHATEPPAALNAAHAIVNALRDHKDPATGKPFSTHCHADSRIVDLWLEASPDDAVSALGEGPCAIFLIGNAFCSSDRCTRELLHATLKGTASIPVILERPCSDERQFQAWVADTAGAEERKLAFDPDEAEAVWRQARVQRAAPADKVGLSALAGLVCADCRRTVGTACASCSQWSVAAKKASVDLTEALRQLGRLVDAEIERSIRRAKATGSVAQMVKGAPDSAFARPGEFLPTPVQTPQLEPEPEISQEDGIVEIVVQGEHGEGLVDTSVAPALIAEIKAAIVAALWAETAQIEMLPASDIQRADRRLVVLLRNCPEGQTAARLMQRVTVDALDVQLCRHETSALHIRVVVAGLPRWGMAALASAALGGSVLQAPELGPAELPFSALTHRIQAALRSESARFSNVRFTNEVEVTIDGAAVAIVAAPAQESDASISRPRSTASAASIDEPDEKRLRSTTEISVSTSAEMGSSDADDAAVAVSGGARPTRSDESMRDESDSSVPRRSPGDSDSTSSGAGGAGTETESQSEEESDADEEDDGVKISTGREDRMAAPVVKLSYKLIETYNHINEVYYTKQKEKKKWDDKNSDYIIKAGDVVGNGRYRLKKVIGSGSFGQVVSAIDTHAPGLCDACALPGDAKGLVAGISDYPQHPTGRCEVAIKIIKNKPAFHRQAKIEIELLTLLNGLQSNSRFDPNLVRMLAHFEHRDHIWYERAVESSRV